MKLGGAKLKVYVKTPARLHMGLIDLNGDLGRIFGGLGVAINKPNVTLEARTSKGLTVTGEKTEIVRSLATRFLESYKLEPNVELQIKETIPEHTGLGSGTQLALAVASALSRLYGINASEQELSKIMGRGRRTGVGTAIFSRGGFVVDGGKPLKKATPLNQILSPTIFRRDFPEDWRFVVAVPSTYTGLANHEEAQAFEQLASMPSEKVGKICRLIVMKLLPALIEKDIKSFGEALTDIQIAVGENFSSVQGGRYSNNATADGIAYMHEQGVYGVGQSSWGPAFYGLVQNKKEAKDLQTKMQNFLRDDKDGKVFIAKPNNHGVYIKVIESKLETPLLKMTQA